MGAGKSTVGQVLARTLGRKFVDMDEVVISHMGMTIPEAFAGPGESFFRRAETKVLKKLAAKEGLVVSTGGGAPEAEVNRELMRASGLVVHLDAALDTCRNRLPKDAVAERPLWRDTERLNALYNHRRELYNKCDLAVQADHGEPRDRVQIILAHLLPEEHFIARLDNTECPVAAVWNGPDVLKTAASGRKTVILTDRNVARLHLDRYLKAVEPALVITVAPGERSKTLNGARRVYEALLEANIERGDLLVAVGGGMVTDLGAFVAATYKRGMDFMLVSTSLLGCVDAAVGGKAAINLGSTKNMVGCFTMPKQVILDWLALGTLPRRHRAEGLVEAYKTGLVADANLAELVTARLKHLLAGDLIGLARTAHLSARAKARVVAEDFRESGRRMILNFGHTYGHAVEGFNRFKISHGQSVAAGMVVAINLSQARGLLTDDKANQMREVLSVLTPDRRFWPGAAEAWRVMTHDKKNRGGKVLFVLLDDVAQPVIVEDVTQTELARTIDGEG
nr:bifunctional shikimate kinase/3-dehydroquinate synthase [uncultured Sphaerochaeta sp.]